jgi:hypothetical protein
MAMRLRLLSIPALGAMAVCAMLLSACGALQPNQSAPNVIPGGPGDPSFSRLGGEDSGVIFRLGGNRPPAIGASNVNAFLWRGALDTLSSQPLTSADAFGGVIITDWHSQPGAPGERFKTTAFVAGPELRGDGVQVNVFRQVSVGGRWVDAPVNPAIQAELRNRVLDRARKLRDQATGQG